MTLSEDLSKHLDKLINQAFKAHKEAKTKKDRKEALRAIRALNLAQDYICPEYRCPCNHCETFWPAYDALIEGRGVGI